MDSFLENNLALVIAPNMTEIEVSYAERFAKSSDRFLQEQRNIAEKSKLASDASLKNIKLENQWFATLSGHKDSCTKVEAAKNITIFALCAVYREDNPRRVLRGCADSTQVPDKERKLASSIDQLDRSRNNLRIFAGQSNSFFEVFRGEENVK